METENYHNWLKLETDCKERTLELLRQYCLENQDILNEYIPKVFKKDSYGLPADAEIFQIRHSRINNGLITLQVQLMDSEKKLYMCAFVASIDELELYKKLKDKTI